MKGLLAVPHGFTTVPQPVASLRDRLLWRCRPCKLQWSDFTYLINGQCTYCGELVEETKTLTRPAEPHYDPPATAKGPPPMSVPSTTVSLGSEFHIARLDCRYRRYSVNCTQRLLHTILQYSLAHPPCLFQFSCLSSRLLTVPTLTTEPKVQYTSYSLSRR